MRILQIDNAQVSVEGDDGYSFGTQKLIMNVVFQNDNEPMEQDTPSGAWWIWPMRQGMLQISGILPPGHVPPDAPKDLVKYTITVTADDINGDPRTITINNCYRSAFQAQIQQLGEAMPAFQIQVSYQVFLDDDGQDGDWTATP